MATRVLVISLDSAEPLLLQAWVEQGGLPAIGSLIRSGHSQRIENLPGFGNGVFWPSLYTGTDPSHHGGYYLCQPRPPTWSLEPFCKHDYLLPPFWRTLEDEGFDVAIIDPIESPTGNLSRGVEIMDWIVHRREAAPTSTPPALIDEVLDRYGDDPFGGNIDRTVKVGTRLEDLSDISQQRIERKTKAAIDLLDTREWDLLMVNFSDPHDLGHMTWHLHEGNAGSSAASNAGNPLWECLHHLDRAVAELMSRAGPDAQTFLITGPGMERNVSANMLLPEILRGLHGKSRAGPLRAVGKLSRAIAHSELLPWRFRKWFMMQRARVGLKTHASSGQPYAWVPHNDNAGAVRFNLAGREPNGVVPVGDYQALSDELSGKLLGMRDASGDKSAVARVLKLREMFSGPALDRLPDIMVVWNRDADLSTVSSPHFGHIHRKDILDRTGDHSTRGIVVSDRAFDCSVNGPISPMQVTPILLGAVQTEGARRFVTAPVAS